MMVLIEDFKNLTMSVLSRACVRFYGTDTYYQGCGLKSKYKFEYNEKFRELLNRKIHRSSKPLYKNSDTGKDLHSHYHKFRIKHERWRSG